jgi:hypothetical protein
MAKVNNKTKGFGSIPRDVVYDNELSDRARFVYVYMACKPENWEFYQDKVANELGYGKDTLRKYLDELIIRGWITENEQQNDGKFGCLEYVIEVKRKVGNLPIRKKADSEKTRNGKIPNQRKIDNISSKQSLSDNKEIENKKRLSNDNQKVEYSEDFISFWSIYHNGGKQQAYKAWNKLTANEKQRAFDNVTDYLLFCKYKGRTQKDTSSYLNQKGFDEHWLATPDYYVVHDGDDGNLIKFKTYMVANHLALLFHRNPLTFEQIHDCFDKYTVKQTEIALHKLKQRDIHQYFSIAKGIEAVIADDPLFDEMEKEDEQ